MEFVDRKVFVSVLVIIVLMLGVISAESPPRFPNVGYLGSTYNIFEGNPASTKGLDPGFTLRSVYSLTYEKGQETADGRYSIPDFTNITQSSACNFQFQSSTTQNTASYTKSLQVHVDADFSGWGASFSASADYIDVDSGTTSSQKIFVSSHATCESYGAFIIPFVGSSSLESTLPIMDPAFKEDVYYLSTQGDNDTYFNLIDKWGTHYAYSLHMGGRYGVRSTFLSSEYIDMAASGLDISAAAGYSSAYSINANLTTDIQKNQSEQYDQHRSDYQVYQIGGTPVVSQESEEPYYQWAQTVKDNPLPIRYTLQPLSDILTAMNFPADKNIAVKQANLQEIIIQYCLTKLDIDTTLCTANTNAEEDTIPVTIVSDYNPVELAENVFIGVQQVSTTQTFIIGGFLQYTLFPEYTPFPSVIVNNPELPSDLIKEAESWKDALCISNDKCLIRPICPNGYSSVSDFYCGDSSSKDACLITIPRNLPCIADHCLTQCTQREFKVYSNTLNKTEVVVSLVYNGDIYFGSGNELYIKDWTWYNNFFRYATANEAYDLNLFKCLSYTCLSFV